MSIRSLISAIAGLVALAAPAHAEWPTEPTTINMLITNAPGGGADIAARTFAPFLQKYLGPNATVVPINRPGAGGALAFNELAQAAPDGRTISLNPMPNLATRIVEDPNQRYSLDSFVYLGKFTVAPGSIVVSAQSPYKTIGDLVDDAKAKPGQLMMSVGGIGNDDHLNALRLVRVSGADIKIVPMGGEPEARNAVMGGHVQMSAMSPLVALDFTDRLRVLGLTSPERAEFAPDIPTLKEQGLDIVAQTSKGFIAPAGLPDEIKQAYAKAIEAAVQDPGFLAEAKKQRLIIVYTAPDAYEQEIRAELTVFQDLFKAFPWK